MAKKDKYLKYSPEFKLSVILDMRENYLGYRETVRKYWNTTIELETTKTTRIYLLLQ